MVIDVEKIRSVCKSKGTSLTKVEKALGFSNGAIGKWAKSQGGPSYDRILKVAQALCVNVEDLTAGQKEEPTPVSESGHSAAAIAFMERHPDLTEEDYRFLHEQAELLELRRIHQGKK